jgi:putative PIN family toxin of toxin-antitoxin system
MTVVFDTNTVVRAIFWPRSTDRRAFVGLARRQFIAAVSSSVFDEYERIAGVLLRERFPDTNPAGALAWLRMKCLWVEPAPLGRARSRDPKADPVLATAVAARAAHLVAGDRDLLDLGKPFGIAMVTAGQFLRCLEPIH